MRTTDYADADRLRPRTNYVRGQTTDADKLRPWTNCVRQHLMIDTGCVLSAI